LEQVSITIRNNNECYFTLNANQICAGDGSAFAIKFGTKTYDSCQGDSGGPLVVKENGKFYQTGIVSYGGDTCDGVGVYTNVASYLTWISTRMV
jgi:secreted trypsin-like serine protease